MKVGTTEQPVKIPRKRKGPGGRPRSPTTLPARWAEVGTQPVIIRQPNGLELHAEIRVPPDVRTVAGREQIRCRWRIVSSAAPWVAAWFPVGMVHGVDGPCPLTLPLLPGEAA